MATHTTNVSRQFAADFETWAAAQLADGDTPEGIEEIRQALREAFAAGGEDAEYWRTRITSEAAAIRNTTCAITAHHQQHSEDR
jgi:hypothetical protein